MGDGGTRWGNPLGEPAPNAGYNGGTRPQRGFIWRLSRGYCGAIVGLSKGYCGAIERLLKGL